MDESGVCKVFLNFCNASKRGSTRASNKTVARIFMDSGLYTKDFSVVDCDIAFMKFTGKKTKVINFVMFKHFLKTLTAAGKLEHPYEEVLEIISKASPKPHSTTKICNDAASTRLSRSTHPEPYSKLTCNEINTLIAQSSALTEGTRKNSITLGH